MLVLDTGGELQDADSHVTRHKPEGLESLCRTTKFSRKELQILYRGFKQVVLIAIHFVFGSKLGLASAEYPNIGFILRRVLAFLDFRPP